MDALAGTMSDTTGRLRAAIAERYRIDRELGRGGMATVYLAEDLRHHRKVAIKVLHSELSSILGPERFLKEIELTASLQHPHILALYDSGAAAELRYYVMPYVEGESLRARLVREKQLPVSDAVRISTEVASALDYAHRHGVVHRDIKPENILLQEGRALVADFGIALAVQQAGGNRMTRTGISLGTPEYMSPEQAMGERDITSRSDIYSLGCVTYEMLVGEPPFSGPNAQAILARVTTEEPKPISPERRTVPAHVEGAVLTALSRLPADRFATAADFAAPLARDRRRPGQEAPLSPRARALPFGLAAATVLAVGWAGWEATRRQSEPAPPITFTIPAQLAPNPRGNLIAFSPDGMRLVFVEAAPGTLRSHLVLRRLDRTDPQPLVGTEGAGSPFFSPDGKWVGFSQGSRLRKIRPDGRGATTIVDIAPDQAGRASWGPDQAIVFGTRDYQTYRVPADGGVLKRIPLPDSAGYTAPIWLPGGRELLVTRKFATGQEMAVVSAETGKVESVLGPGQALQYVEPGLVIYLSPENALMAARYDRKTRRLLAAGSTIAQDSAYLAGLVAVAANGSVAYAPWDWTSKELVLVTAEGGTILLPVGTQAFRGPRFSPDGQRIAVSVEPGGDLVGDIRIFTRGAETFSLLTREGSSVFPEWTPDGKAVLYSTHPRDGLGGLFRVPADLSGPPARLTGSARYVYEGVLNYRQDTLLHRLTTDGPTRRDIMLLPMGGTPVPFAATEFEEYSPTISPDGRLVLYASNESGRVEVYLRPLSGGGRVQVSSHGGNEPRWGPGGREAYYWSRDTLFAVPITRPPHLGAGTRRAVLSGRYLRVANHANYDIAPDGKTFVMVRQASGNASTVTVLLNWFQSLKQ